MASTRRKRRLALLEEAGLLDTKTKYDYRYQGNSHVVLTVQPVKNNSRGTIITSGFNFSSFLEMGKRGFLTSRALEDYNAYTASLAQGIDDRTLIFCGRGGEEFVRDEEKDETQEDQYGYSQNICQG